MAAVLASCFADQFTRLGGVNYVELGMYHDSTGPLLVTLQRQEGKTPGALVEELRAEVACLKERLQYQPA